MQQSRYELLSEKKSKISIKRAIIYLILVNGKWALNAIYFRLQLSTSSYPLLRCRPTCSCCRNTFRKYRVRLTLDNSQTLFLNCLKTKYYDVMSSTTRLYKHGRRLRGTGGTAPTILGGGRHLSSQYLEKCCYTCRMRGKIRTD